MKISTIATGDNYRINLSDKYIRLFSSVAYETFGIVTTSAISHGSNDSRFFTKKKIPVIVTRPKGGGHHGAEEWIDIKDLKRFFAVLKEFVERAS